jgi:hypothetical protein
LKVDEISLGPILERMGCAIPSVAIASVVVTVTQVCVESSIWFVFCEGGRDGAGGDRRDRAGADEGMGCAISDIEVARVQELGFGGGGVGDGGDWRSIAGAATGPVVAQADLILFYPSPTNPFPCSAYDLPVG